MSKDFGEVMTAQTEEIHRLIVDESQEVIIQVDGVVIRAKTILHRDTGERTYWCPHSYEELIPDVVPDEKVSTDPFEDDDDEPNIWDFTHEDEINDIDDEVDRKADLIQHDRL